MNESIFFDQCVPKKFKSASLEGCAELFPERANFGRKWASNPISIFIHGGYGTGKTYFCFAMIRELFKVSPYIFWPRYFTSDDLDSTLLKSSKSDEGDGYELKNIASQDILFIDDLGRESKSERLKRQYFGIINRRYNEEKITILTSNFTLDQLGDLLDGAISSRIQEWQNLAFKCPDNRSK